MWEECGLLCFNSEYLSFNNETWRHACSSLEENGAGLGFMRCFSLESMRRVTSRSIASRSSIALGA